MIELADGIHLFNGDFRDHLSIYTSQAYVISDPPYNIGYKYDSYADKIGIDEYADMLRVAFNDNPSVVIHYPEEMMNIVSRAIDAACEESVFWVYNSNTARQSRMISWFGCKPNFRMIGQDYKNPNDKRIADRIANGEQARLYDWWEINQVKNVSKELSHPCCIPLEVMERIVLTTTKEGDLIIDPFCGSGTTLVAAYMNRRRAIGFEISERYCLEIIDRFNMIDALFVGGAMTGSGGDR